MCDDLPLNVSLIYPKPSSQSQTCSCLEMACDLPNTIRTQLDIHLKNNFESEISDVIKPCNLRQGVILHPYVPSLKCESNFIKERSHQGV